MAVAEPEKGVYHFVADLSYVPALKLGEASEAPPW